MRVVLDVAVAFHPQGARAVARLLHRLPEVAAVHIRPTTRRVEIEGDASSEDLLAALHDSGFEARLVSAVRG